MARKENIRRFSAAELRKKQSQGTSRSDFRRLDSLTASDLEKAIAADPAFREMASDWIDDVEAVMPVPKKLISLRLDTDVVDWFKEQGSGYQTRINAVLRAFVLQQDHKGGGKKLR